MEFEELIREMKKTMMSPDGMNISNHWWKAIFDIVRDAWKNAEEDKK